MHDPKATDAQVEEIERNDPNTERTAGQADDLDRGTGLGASGGGLGKKAGADFDRALEASKKPEH